MSEREGLERAVIDSPDDDAPRQVFADWLDDHGKAERADFIRAQLRLAQLPEYDREYQEALHLRPGLFNGNVFRLGLSPLPKGIDWARALYRRGFPEGVS